MQATKEDIYDDDEDESIGLSKKGPMFGDNQIFNMIGARFPDYTDHMKALLMKAGMRQDNAIEEFMKSKFTSGLAIFIMILLLLGTNDFDIPFYMSVLIAFRGSDRRR